MCAGCEYVTQQVTQNPTTISMIVGYIVSAGMLVLSYAIVFSRKFSEYVRRRIVRGVAGIHSFIKNTYKF